MSHTAPVVDAYPSRIRDIPEWRDRMDPVVYPRPTGRWPAGPLTPGQLARYERDGFLVLEDVFAPDEVEHLRDVLTRLQDEMSTFDEPYVIREPDSRHIRSIFAVHAHEPTFNEMSRDPRLIGVAKQILGGDVYVHQSRVNYKPGFRGKEFYWHSDFETWHVEDGMPRMRAVSLSVLLDDNLAYNGSLMVIPGSHRTYVACVGATPENHYKTSLRRQEYGVPDENSLRRLVDQGGLLLPEAKAGSVLVFDCNLMHGSNSNITPFSRRNLFLVYNSVENALVAPFSGQRPRPEFVAHREPRLLTNATPWPLQKRAP